MKKIEPIKITVGNSRNTKTIQVQNGHKVAPESHDPDYGPPLPPSDKPMTPKKGDVTRMMSPLAESTPAVVVEPESNRPRPSRENGTRKKKNFEEDLGTGYKIHFEIRVPSEEFGNRVPSNPSEVP